MPTQASATYRLYRFLSDFRAESTRGPGNVMDVLSRLVRVKSLPARSGFEMYGEVLRMCAAAKAEITLVFAPVPGDNEHAGQLSTMLAPISALEQSMLANPLLGNPNTIAQHTPESIQHQAFLVERLLQRQAPSGESLEQVRTKLAEALQVILDSEVESDVKEAFRAAIEHLNRLIDRYDIFGAEGVQYAAGVLVGTMASTAPRASKSTSAAVASALDLVANALAIITAVDSLRPRFAPVLKLLLGDGASSAP